MARTVLDTPLADQPEIYWVNSIFWRLAVATGVVSEDSTGEQQVDPDEILELAEALIAKGRAAEVGTEAENGDS